MRRSTLTLTSTAFLLSSTVFAIAISACGSSDPQPAQSPSATAYPQQYPPGQYPQQYPQQQGYPQQQPYPQQTAYPQPQPQPTAYPSAPATATGQMATPGPLALPCSNDGACGLHRCNVAAGKCAFPCQTPVDCAAGNQCLMGVCAPKAPGSP
jgi:hypothetical protein